MAGSDPGAPCEKAMVPPSGVHVVSGRERLRFNGVAVSSPLPGMPLGSEIVVVTDAVKVTTCLASAVFVPAMATQPLTGMVFAPTVSRPRL
jgi:hypothetical protein